MRQIIMLIVLSMFCGCALFQPSVPSKQEIIDSYDLNQLKTTEKTFKLSRTQVIDVYENNKPKQYAYGSDWFIVHKDHIKTFNENQDSLIQLLEEKKSEHDKFCKYFVLSLLPTIILLFMLGKIYGRKQKNNN